MYLQVGLRHVYPLEKFLIVLDLLNGAISDTVKKEITATVRPLTSDPTFIYYLRQFVERPSWIIDGNYGATMDIRIEAADTVIFLDFPRRICLWNAAKRAIRYRGQTRPDMGEVCPEKFDLEFLQYVWGFRKREQDKILRRMEEARYAGKQVTTLVTRQEVEVYLASCAKETV